MRDEEKVRIGDCFDARAETYDASDVHRWQARVAAELSAPTADDAVLDVATGTGLFLRALPPASERGARVGVDISGRMLSVARQELPAARFVVADAADLPFEGDLFDVVSCIAAIPYLDDVGAAFAEWHRVLRPGGRLIATVVKDGGMTYFALLREAAATAGIELPEPTAGLGDQAALEAIGDERGFSMEDVSEREFGAPLSGDPAGPFQHVLDQGLAEPLRRADQRIRDHVLRVYRTSFAAAADAGQGSHRLLFASWRRR